MNDTVATEDQEQPAGCHQRKARVADRDPGRRTSSGPADICSAPTEAGHMTAADQIVRSAKKVLAMEGRPHMTTFAPILMSFFQGRQRLVLDRVRRRQGSQEVTEIVSKRMKLKTNRVGGERAA
jgi:hypothetical protein